MQPDREHPPSTEEPVFSRDDLKRAVAEALSKAHPLSQAQRRRIRQLASDAIALSPRGARPFISLLGELACSRDAHVAATALSRLSAWGRRARSGKKDDDRDAQLLDIQRQSGSASASREAAGPYPGVTSPEPSPRRQRSIPRGSSPRSIVNPYAVNVVTPDLMEEWAWEAFLVEHTVQEWRGTRLLRRVAHQVLGERGHSPIPVLLDPRDCRFERWPSLEQLERAELELSLGESGRLPRGRTKTEVSIENLDPQSPVNRLLYLRDRCRVFPSVVGGERIDLTGFGVGCTVTHRPTGLAVHSSRMTSFEANRARCEASLEVVLALNTLRPVRLSAIEITARMMAGFMEVLVPEARAEVARLRDESEASGGKVSKLWTWPEKLDEATRAREAERLMLARSRKRVSQRERRKKKGRRSRSPASFESVTPQEKRSGVSK